MVATVRRDRGRMKLQSVDLNEGLSSKNCTPTVPLGISSDALSTNASTTAVTAESGVLAVVSSTLGTPIVAVSVRVPYIPAGTATGS